MLDIRIRKVIEPNDDNLQIQNTATLEIFDDGLPEKVLKTIWIQYSDGDDIQAIITEKFEKARHSIETRLNLQNKLAAALIGAKSALSARQEI